MATFDVSLSQYSTVYSGNGTARIGTATITKLDDGQSDRVFNVGDKIDATWYRLNGQYGGILKDVVYKGTVEWPDGSGNIYPVFANGALWYVVGLNSSAGTANSGLTNLATAIKAETFTVCFFPGTQIATPSGERNVEELVSGDLVLLGNFGAMPATCLGRKFARAVSVKWIGGQTVSTLFGPAERLMPGRFCAKREPWSTERR